MGTRRVQQPGKERFAVVRERGRVMNWLGFVGLAGLMVWMVQWYKDGIRAAAQAVRATGKLRENRVEWKRKAKCVIRRARRGVVG